ncbi:MAG TPA: hypothetical protein ENK18_06910 [Deltaproteobacteria bacterium]|nr:hypothetical protein [Deltaproteobacteria bacterium]
MADSGYTSASVRCPGHRARATLQGTVLSARIPDALCTVRLTGGGPPLQAELRPGRYVLSQGGGGAQIVPGP